MTDLELGTAIYFDVRKLDTRGLMDPSLKMHPYTARTRFVVYTSETTGLRLYVQVFGPHTGNKQWRSYGMAIDKINVSHAPRKLCDAMAAYLYNMGAISPATHNDRAQLTLKELFSAIYSVGFVVLPPMVFALPDAAARKMIDMADVAPRPVMDRVEYRLRRDGITA